MLVTLHAPPLLSPLSATASPLTLASSPYATAEFARAPSPRMDGGGPGPGDLIYIGLLLAVLFGGVVPAIFNQLFVEGGGDALGEENAPPNPFKIGLPGPLQSMLGGSDANDPDWQMAEAERLRMKLQQAIDQQDMAAALAAEKELKQFMIENGINYEFEAPPEKQAQTYSELPFPQEIDRKPGQEQKGSRRSRRRGPDAGVV